MLSVTRTPLTSPAVRAVVSASSYASFPFHSATPSPLSLAPLGSLPRINLTGSPRTPHSPNLPGSPTFGGYFSLTVPSSLRVPGSPRCLAPPHIAVHTPPVSQCGENGFIFTNVTSAKQNLDFCLDLGSATATKRAVLTAEKSTETRARRRPSFKLDIPRPNFVRDDSFEAVALAGILFTPGTPGELTRSDSEDSVVTLKPSKGRVSTPYPKLEQGEWLEDVDKIVGRDNVQARMSRLL